MGRQSVAAGAMATARAMALTVSLCSLLVGATRSASVSVSVSPLVHGTTGIATPPWSRRLSRRCDPHAVNTTLELASLPAWRRQAGWWVGNLSLYGVDGTPSVSAGWPYRFDAYAGFLHIRLDGARLVQRNVFVYPPLPRAECAARSAAGRPTVVGGGTCGVHGNERVFEADQAAADCAGNMAGSGSFGPASFESTTTVVSPDTLLYRVQLPGVAGEAGLLQNQLTTTTANGRWRVRNAQSWAPTPVQPTLRGASFYRERRVSREEWDALLAAARAAARVRRADYCAWDAVGAPQPQACTSFFAG
eukprot:TRINITY_DN3508_c0_g1_i1.p2 TRINITY_DN3508_c0_g1~~TRINITY_DN3508_c0_g1_i1.p2  ORF type:complete len:305 (+),score=60.06 TRINITY_DN3508_c0_g1_i1:133-1047(+)